MSRENSNTDSMSDREAVEAIGIGAAQESFFVGRALYRGFARLCGDENPVQLFEEAVERTHQTIEEFERIADVLDRHADDEAVVRDVERIDWAHQRVTGEAAGYLHSREMWTAVVGAVERGDPAVPVRIEVAKLSKMSQLLETLIEAIEEEQSRRRVERLSFQTLRLYTESILLGVTASSVNMAVGKQRGVETVPDG